MQDHREVAEETDEEQLLDRQLGEDLQAGHRGRLTAAVHLLPDGDQVPEEEEADARGHHQQGPPRAVEEEEPPPQVDQPHAGGGADDGEQVEQAHRRTSEGPLDRSPRSRLRTSSALIRHIGNPMPGREA